MSFDPQDERIGNCTRCEREVWEIDCDERNQCPECSLKTAIECEEWDLAAAICEDWRLTVPEEVSLGQLKAQIEAKLEENLKAQMAANDVEEVAS